MPYPKMMRIIQHFEVTTLPDVAEAVRQEVAKLNLQGRIKSGDSVAITVGSRGVANIALIVKTLVEELKAMGAAPFIELLVEMRDQLRQAKRFDLADSIRSRLAELGIALEDTAQGTTWRRRD